jgi:mannose/fructose/N-acetylgalactosamine-specific phosphotransferase system component IIC
MAAATGGVIPAMVWAVLWSLISLAILGITMALYYKSLRRKAAVANGISLPMLLDTNSRSAADRSL